MNLRFDLPAAPGAYALHLRLARPLELAVGRLGMKSFPAGEYLYLGSACGPGGLRSRLGRHLQGEGKRRWHIDYLRLAAEVGGCIYVEADVLTGALRPPECMWSQALAGLPEAAIPAPGFGAGDCRCGCRAHLVAFPWQEDGLRSEAGLFSKLVGVLSRAAGVAMENLVLLG